MEYNTGNIEKYSSKNPLKQWMIKCFLKKLQNVFGNITETYKNENIDVLDIGCGEGLISNLLYDNFQNIKITAVDYFAEAIERAKQNNNRQILFETGDITNLKYADKNFDIVLATEVLEHLSAPQKAVQELLRVANKAIILSVPNEPFFCLGNFLSGKNMPRLGNPIDHINHWTYHGFRKFLQKEIPSEFSVKQYNCYVWTLVVITNAE